MFGERPRRSVVGLDWTEQLALRTISQTYAPELTIPLKIAHIYQESGLRFSEPQAAQLHIYHTIHGLQQVGHQVSLLALQGRQVLCTQDRQVFKSDQRLASHYAQLGLSGTA